MNNIGTLAAHRLSREKPLSIAILAMGGQGGGVLADWIVAAAEAQGWVAQSTSVPGVAQRTGATIYYIEMMPAKDGVPPVLSLIPMPGDVDVVMAAEWMEAGRSVMRGLVTPDRTTLIASTHRTLAVVEKEKPGDNICDPNVVIEATSFAAKRVIAFDMDKLAAENSSVISAAMLGALAASEALPIARMAFEQVIRSGTKGVDASLKAFSAAYARVRDGSREAPRLDASKTLDDLPDKANHPDLNRLVARIRADFPESVRPMLFAGTKRVVDFQDVAYGSEYLDCVASLYAFDRSNGGEAKGFTFTREGAKYVAVAMAYDDVVRVADLKTRRCRFTRIRAEVGATPEQLVYPTEFLQPRREEICGALPAALGQWIEVRPRLFQMLDGLFSRGRRIGTGRIGGFMMLYLVASFRAHRRGSLRFARETRHRQAWLALARETLPKNYDLATEILRCRRLVKGYADTRDRGQSKFDRVLAAVPSLMPRTDGAAWLERMKRAAMLDEAGTALEGVAKTIETL
jgi:indolepyruvate ferredoxin oxidoreductase beta subunit